MPARKGEIDDQYGDLPKSAVGNRGRYILPFGACFAKPSPFAVYFV
jgi:hypothetical protein